MLAHIELGMFDHCGSRFRNWSPPSLTPLPLWLSSDKSPKSVNRHSTMTHYQRPNMTHPQEGGTGGEVSEILFFSAKSKRRPSLIYSMQIIPVCLSIVARRKGVSATRRGGLNLTPISLLVGHPCKLFHTQKAFCKAQKFPLTFELANLATTVGVRHGLVSLGAQQYYSGGCLVGETTVKGGMLFERVLIGYGPVGNISASSGLFIFLDMAR